MTSLLFLHPVFGAQEKPAEPAKQAAENQAPASPYAGSETCQMCHEDLFKAFQRQAHHVVDTDKRRGWETRACEGCHGPGAKHAESLSPGDIRNPAKLAPSESANSCLQCHLNQQAPVGRVHNGHGRQQVACVSCHTVHKPQPIRRTREQVNQLCAGCHVNIWASFQRPYKHPLPQGAMACTDCHNPHGSTQARQIRVFSSNEPGCLKCHGDKRGPFTFEHAPVRLEPCSTCHEPHGSSNPRMLVRAQVRLVCLECHANIGSPAARGAPGTIGGVPPAFHDLRSTRYQNCTICHVKVHGSHVSEALLR